MSFLELARKRQSIRNYRPDSVPVDVLDRCFEAARLAPSACNSQPWYFIAVTDKNLIRKIAERAFSGIYAMNRFAIEAPVIVVVVTERSRYTACLGGYFRGTQYNLIDIGIAVEHFVLQATEEGLGACWIGWFNEREIHRILNIPRRRKIDILLTVGYPASEEIKTKKRRALDEIRRYI
ncbi:MAG: nitroreductase family protein [Candidatus Omnitrophica bacterium]|nr:nitroreductase family protein [Candidatus Omnitrophota bacterium]MCM8789209.1 nitroreductase family protein [Candidatus Omnitrophota bacterium]